MNSPRIVLLTGDLESGKTRLCLEISRAAREAGIQVAGVLSPAVFKAGQKVGIDLLDPKTLGRRSLAVLRDPAGSGPQTRRWSFLEEALAWGSQLLESAVPCELLLVDELGPLEFNQNQGWVEGFEAVNSGLYRTALLVIRPSLLQQAANRWQVSRVIDLDDPGQGRFSAREFLQAEGLLPAP